MKINFDRLNEDSFQSLLANLWPGKEFEYLSCSEVVMDLSSQFSSCPDAGVQVEQFVEPLFSQLKPGVEFEHAELIMAVVTAARNADMDIGFIAEPVLSSDYGELSRLRRFLQAVTTNGA